MGTLFSYSDLQSAVELGQMYANVQYNPDHAYRQYPYTVYSESDIMIGVDPAGGSGSEFAILGTQIWNQHLHVFCAETYSRPNYDRMVDRIVGLWRDGTSCRGTIYVDANNPSFIRILKQNMGNGERVDYEDQIDRLRARGYAGDNDILLSDHMKCVPVNFRTHGPRLLQTASLYIQRRLIAIHPDFKDLIASMQSAETKQHTSTDWSLDKSEYSHDILDALRCSMYDLRIENPNPKAKLSVTV
jgi:hypothetical protein